MKITFVFDSANITVEKFGDVWSVSDSIYGYANGSLDVVMKALRARRREAQKSKITGLVDLLYRLDLTRYTVPTMLEVNDQPAAYIVPQDNNWVVVPLGWPQWLNAPACGKSVIALTAMWRQWMEKLPEDPDLKELETALSKL